MKINYKLGIFLITSSVVIILLNFCGLHKKKSFLFNRNMNSNLQVEKLREGFNNIGNKHIINSTNNLIVEDVSTFNNDSLMYHTLFLTNILDSTLSSQTKIVIPKSARIAFCNETGLLCIDKLSLFVYTFKSKKYIAFPFQDFNLIKVFSLKNALSKILCLGEQKIGSDYITGFYVIDLDSNKIVFESKAIESNKKPTAIQNILIYSGEFMSNDDLTVSFFCDKFSKIYCFDYNGRLKNEFTTMDNTPKPILVFNSIGFFYKRGFTFLTNNGVIVNNNKAMVFSARTENMKTIVIDFYSLNSNIYLYSCDFYYKQKSCADINFIRSFGNKIYIKFRDRESCIFSYSLN